MFVADSSFAAIELLDKVSRLPGASLVTRLRMDAALYDPAPVRKPGTHGRPRLKGKRRPTLQQVLSDPQTKWERVTIENWYGEGEREVEVSTETAVWYHNGKPPVPIRWFLIRDPGEKFEPQALLSTNLRHTAAEVLKWFVCRWTMEVTLEEARAHLGLETQRQWNDLAIARTTPVLFALYSIITLSAHRMREKRKLVVRTAAWYQKEQPTFSDAIAWVRRDLWSQEHFSMSGSQPDVIKIPRSLFERLTDAVCYAA